MILEQVLDGIIYETKINVKTKVIKNVTADSRNVCDGDVFVCISGIRFDGHDFAKKSLMNKDIVVVTQKDIGLENQIIVSNTKKAYAMMVANLFGNPSKQLKLIGVTGTNGKTSTTYIIKSILEGLGNKVGLIGTIQNEVDDMAFPAKYTTPDPLELNVLFKKMVDAGCNYVVMEISSHALDQERVYGLHFELAIFTNLTQDHLDYHGDMESYFKAKCKLFQICNNAVVNIDDDYGKRLYNELSCNKVSYSVERQADFYCKDICVFPSHTNFSLITKSDVYSMKINMLGKFFVANAIASVSATVALGFDIHKMLEILKNCKGVKGRAEILNVDADFTIIRDYAHGPDGISKILDAVNEFATGRVVILFGCAGNRDRTKRKIMADIAAQKSDFVILTSDNPRDENPLRIIDDAKPGLESNVTPYKIIVDRYEAIEWAIENSQKNDILILAGKGHEDYQVLDFGTIYFDEYKIVSDIIAHKNLLSKI